MCLPLVTVLSRLGLYASPEKNVRSSGPVAGEVAFLYSFTTVWKRAMPPTGSAEPGLKNALARLLLANRKLFYVLDMVYIIEMQ